MLSNESSEAGSEARQVQSPDMTAKKRCSTSTPHTGAVYRGCENDYGKLAFRRTDFARLAEIIGHIKGRFIMSLNDVEGVRETFSKFRIEEIKTTYTIGTKGRSSGTRSEILISNYNLDQD